MNMRIYKREADWKRKNVVSVFFADMYVMKCYELNFTSRIVGIIYSRTTLPLKLDLDL